MSPVEVWVNNCLPQGQGLWVQQTWVCHKPSWRRSPLTPSHNCQKCSEGSNKTLCIPGDPQRLSQICLLVFECLLQHYGSAAACCRGRGFGCSRPGCGIRLLGDGHRNPTIEPQELTQDWGNRLVESSNKILCECLLWKYRSAVAFHKDRGSGCSRPGYGISPLGGGCH